LGLHAPYTDEGRGDLRRLDLEPVRTAAREVLASVPEVAGAYLFGSALGWVGQRSDIDLGLISRAGLPAEAELDVAGRVEERLGRLGPHAFHVTVLREEENAFTFRVLRDGELVYVADGERVADMIEAVGRQHDDLEPFRRTFYAALRMPL